MKLKYLFWIGLMPLVLMAGKPKTPTFQKIKLHDAFISEGATIADINDDGELDVVAGTLWWQGPELKKSYSFSPVKNFNIKGPGLSGYSDNFLSFSLYLTNDKWVDLLRVGLPGKPIRWFKNPGEAPFSANNHEGECESIHAVDNVCNESPQLLDILDNAKPEFLCFSKNQIVVSVPSEEGAWPSYPISPKNKRFSKYTHGLGVGDINGDGLNDVLEKSGWWEQPVNWDKQSHWVYHKYIFSKRGGSQMYAFDVDGDGDNDVVSSLNAHGYGLAWFEQIQSIGSIAFVKHDIMGETEKANKSPVFFSQLHAMDCVDVDGDGIKDIVTGKRYYAHNGKDPGAEDGAVLYWFKTHRLENGEVTFTPHLIDDDSGVGCQVTCKDLNGDKKIDIVVSNKKGVFAFIQNN